jgi:hypothetical protein
MFVCVSNLDLEKEKKKKNLQSDHLNSCEKHKTHFGFSIFDNGLSSILQNVLGM